MVGGYNKLYLGIDEETLIFNSATGSKHHQALLSPVHQLNQHRSPTLGNNLTNPITGNKILSGCFNKRFTGHFI